MEAKEKMEKTKTAKVSKSSNGTQTHINPADVQNSLRDHMLVDGFDITIDLENSKGVHIIDLGHNKKFYDFYTFFASNPLGMNHPKMEEPAFKKKLGEIALTKPSLSDIYLVEQAEFVETFFRVAVPDYFKYAFFIEGGAMAVENALKAAFDWKIQKNLEKGYKEEKGTKILHFTEAFHGRSGYTLSLTNTDPNKTKFFPKFDWPRVVNPKITFPLNEENLNAVEEAERKAIDQINSAIKENKDDIAAIILEPIQGEGGDNHFRKEFFEQLRNICDREEILLIFDEVQTGIALTGKMWAHEYFVKPDIISFGKKTQVCGILCTGRIDEVKENVFKKPGRINSTWGGNLVDMYRFKRILEIIEEDNLVQNSRTTGEYLKEKMLSLIEKFDGKLSNGRGLGLMCAFDCETKELRNEITGKAFGNGLLILGCGERSIRLRPTLCISKDEVDEGLKLLEKTIESVLK